MQPDDTRSTGADRPYDAVKERRRHPAPLLLVIGGQGLVLIGLYVVEWRFTLGLAMLVLGVALWLAGAALEQGFSWSRDDKRAR